MDIVDLAQGALTRSPIHALRVLRVQLDGDSLVLSGQVDSFYHKQLAQEIVRSVARTARIVNTIDVCYDGHPDS